MKELDNTQLNNVQEQIEQHRNEITKLRKVEKQLLAKKYTDILNMYHYYKFKDVMGDVTYYGLVTNLWYDTRDDEWVFEFCGFGGELEQYFDMN